MSHRITRKSAIRSLPAIRAACAAFGLPPPAVNGDRVTIHAGKYTGAYAGELPVPIDINLTTGVASFDHDFTRQVAVFLAAVIAEQHRHAAQKEGLQFSKKTVTVNGRRVLRVTVEG